MYKKFFNTFSRFSSDCLRKNTPLLYNKFRKLKVKLTYNTNYFKNLHCNNINLFDSLKNTSYYNWKKNFYFKNKNSISNYAFVEINNSCNINCIMCDTKSSTRQKAIMKVDLFENIIKELKKQNISIIGLHTIGDPLANNRLKFFFEILRKHNFKTSISTNGLLLKKNLDTLIEYFDICPDIRFSIDGIKKETYEKIRFGGKFEDLIENLNLAKDKLKPLGFRLSSNLTLTKDNFGELGEYIVFFKNYFDDLHHNMSMNFMTSLSPSNQYFLNNNIIEEKTYLNKYCKYTSRFSPYFLVNGKISVCCRDYDGSLIVDDFDKEKNFKNVIKNQNFKELQNFQENHLKQKSNKFSLCESCYEIDERVSIIWANTLKMFLYFNQNKKSSFYQKEIESLISILKQADNKIHYIEFIKKNTTLKVDEL